jgi:uncharacterized protein (DUF111 family)
VRVKVATSNLPDDLAIWNIQPEFEYCAAIARQYHLPWQTVYDLAQQAARAIVHTPAGEQPKS